LETSVNKLGEDKIIKFLGKKLGKKRLMEILDGIEQD
jgi:hypothetical protein